MFGLFKALRRKPSARERPPSDGENHDLLKKYEALVVNRMQGMRPRVQEAFAALFASVQPDNPGDIHIEIFLDEAAFSFRVFDKTKDDVWADEPEAVMHFNNTVDGFWPIVTDDEVMQFLVWEHDPEHGRIAAIEQPIDELNIPGIVLPWLREIVSETRGICSRKVTARVHDITSTEEM